MPVSFHTSNPQRGKKVPVKGVLLVAILMILLMAALHWLIFGFMVPRTASFGLPHKWNHIPLRESRSTARNYYGDPVETETSADTWYFGAKDKRYLLKVYYQYDTIATAYSIRYRYDKWFGARSYLLDTGTIR